MESQLIDRRFFGGNAGSRNAQRRFQRHYGHFELFQIRFFGSDALEPQAGLNQGIDKRITSLFSREFKNLIRAAGN